MAAANVAFFAVLAATTVLTAAQISALPPHTLFVPRSYHISNLESFTFISYSSTPFEVKATVVVGECQCNLGTRRCAERGRVFSEDSATTRLGRQVRLQVQMPGISDLRNRNYYISVSSNNGSNFYLTWRSITFFNTAFGFLLVKTDKPIYRPEQDVNFCLVHVDKSLRPLADDSMAEVTVRDAKFRQIMKWENVRLEAGNFTCLDFPLSDEPNLGTWRVNAVLTLPEQRQGCFTFSRPAPATCTFRVEEFVLPRFEVTLDGPEQILRDDRRITGSVSVFYTFGEAVQGTVKINATLESSSRRESLPVFEQVAATLRGGRATFSFSANRYRNAARYRYDPFCVRSRLEVTAEVTEAGRGTKMAETISIPLTDSPVDLGFASDNPKLFRPGLNYTVKALARLGDGSPASGVGVRVRATINNDQGLLFDDVMLSQAEDGLVTSTILVPPDANCLKISLQLSSQEAAGCTQETECFSPSPVFSPTGSFLQLEDVTSSSAPHIVGRLVTIQATSTTPFTYLHVLFISQGGIEDQVRRFIRRGTTSVEVSVRITAAMAPRVKVLGYFAREDGELVADLIEVQVTCLLENQGTVQFEITEPSASPGQSISILTSFEPDSIVLLSVIDRSLTLLAEECNSLDTSNICRLLRALTGGSLFGGSRCQLDNSETSCCPSTCSEPTRYGVTSFFNAAGVTLSTNMFQPSPPPVIRPPTFPKFPFSPEIGRPLPTGPPIEAPIEDGDEERATGPAEEEGARTFFPESWIFSLLRTDSEGQARFESTVPDTITSWVAEGVGLSQGAGLGVSPPSELTVIKPFFVSLELPFSINFGETVTVIPLVFYFGQSEQVEADVTVEVDDDLDIVESSLVDGDSITVDQGSSSPITLRLRPRAIGRLSITVSATNDQGETDTVRKLLFVKPGCERFDITQNVFAEGSGEQCFDYVLPTCVIPGSAAATISVTGDVMSPPNLDNILVLPTGCGEQNLVKTATNWVVGEYLVATEQLSDFIAVKIRNNIQRGFQRQLIYLQSSGCFSVWTTASCSLWLTAAAVNTFSGIASFYRTQEPGVQLIDQAVVDGALNYIINNQRASGEVPLIGRVHNFGLLNDEGSIAHTAFVLVALKQYRDAFPTSNQRLRVNRAITRSEDYLQDEFDESGDSFCSYALALSAVALDRPRRRLLNQLRARITTSTRFAGACFLCNECPSNLEEEEEEEEGADCTGRPRNEGSSACVESTAYALLALLKEGDTGRVAYTPCLAQWLVRIRSGSGGFRSSQDTVIALHALARFAEVTFTTELDTELTFALSGPPAAIDPIAIDADNRFERFDVEVPSVPSSDNCVRWNGTGTVIIQSTLEYYGCSCCDDTRSFDLELASVRDDSPPRALLELSIRIRYLAGKSSNMAIVDVEIPSGFLFTDHRFLEEEESNAALERVDARGSNVIFYFTDVPSREATTFVVGFAQDFTVESSQQLPVTIYDYYDPAQTVTRYYLPVTSDPLPVTPPPATRVPPETETPAPPTTRVPPETETTAPPTTRVPPETRPSPPPETPPRSPLPE